MMNWNNIRPLNGNQQDGFEEMICQLAKQEPQLGKSSFVRVGKPDGGKECFWRTENGGIYAWQAKYFTSAFTEVQWRQIENSVTDTIDRHPMLVSYTVCCPLDRPDGQVKGRTSLLAKWDQKVKDWEAYATAKGMNVRFHYWGSSEIITRLSKKQNEGMRYFWFNQEEFTDEWFKYKNSESINALGGRYTSELNFELPIAKIFSGLQRDEEFIDQLNKLFNKIFEAYRSLHLSNEEPLINLGQQLASLLSKFKTLYLSTNFIGNKIINYQPLTDHIQTCHDITDDIKNELYRLQNEMERTKPTPRYSSPALSLPINDLRKLSDQLYHFNHFLSGPECRLSNLPVLIIVGEAGAGKSHLLADIVKQRSAKGQLSLLLLGETFTTRAAPWTQILHNQLRKPAIDEHVFLGALNAKAEATGSRLLFMIDALNEGEGRFIWPKYLETFITLIQQYPYLGLAVSIRDSFTNLIAPDDIITDDLAIRIEHTGFADTSYQASLLFFKHYGILPPGSPMLNPEFQNPLFLKLFCKSLQQRGLHSIPPGYTGITAIIDSYLDGINDKLASVEEWEFDVRLKLVRKAVHNCLQRMVIDGTDHLSYEKAAETVEKVFQQKCNRPHPYLERLISEGVFNIDLYWDDAGNNFTVVHFAYQRFQDHLIVSTLLDHFMDINDPVTSFQTGKLYELVKDQKAIHLNRNLIEALTIQLPEKTGYELFELAPACETIYGAAQSFVHSLLWRKENAIGKATRDYVNKIILHDEGLFDLFMETTISTTMRPGYYFNANSLHNYLKNFNRQTRDLEWTTWLQNKYGEDAQHNPVQRLIDWSFDTKDTWHISDEAIALGVNTLAWFLVSSNRYLRDSATKSLVNLLQHRLHLIVPLLQKFENVDDIYITERLFAAAYGCVLRADTAKNIRELAIYTFEKVFNQPMVIAHDLLRDYARGIVEIAAFRGFANEIDLQRVKPPYRSKRIPTKMPSVATIDKKYSPKGDQGNYGNDNWGATAILNSMTTEYGRGVARYGDFGRYVFGYSFSDFAVDEAKLSNYAVDLIFKMGYDPELFSDFDGQQGSGRGSGHKERIGKKYQWIILHELLARVSDHCKLYQQRHLPELGTFKYQGPWDGSRDIDPSILIRKTKRSGFNDQAEGPWMKQFQHNWEQDNHDWIRDKNSQPDPPEVFGYKDNDGVDWLWLNIHPVWTQPPPLGEDKHESPYKEVWYFIRSYFIRKDDLNEIKKGVAAGFSNRQFDEAKSLSNVFNREFYNAPAYLFFTDSEGSQNDWIDIYHRRTGVKIGDVLRTTEIYSWEKEFDCSKEEALVINKPSRALSLGLDLKYSTNEGEMLDKTGQLVCFDPSVNHKSSRGLLIRKSSMETFLEKEQLALIWTVVGEKQVNARNWRGREYPGRMNMSGIYTLENGSFIGELVFEMDK